MGAHLRASRTLLRRVLPFVLAAAVAKLGVNALEWDTLELNPLFSGLVAADVFLLGFLLAGTLVDYKESERMPCDIAANLESIADECLTLHEAKGDPAATRCVKELQHLARDINSWLRGQHRQERVLRSLEMLNPRFLEMESLIQPAFVGRLKVLQADTRRMVIRIQMIRDTSFVMAGYAIAQSVSVLLIGGLLFVNISPLGLAFFFICMITLFLTYMIFLIADLDDPFDYAEGGKADAEVSLKPLDQLEDRLAASAGRLERGAEHAPAGAMPTP